ncbi:pV [Murine adenovirus 3]|uniref:PV n=1 Tax=Murine adenovirus 3 TaxID=573199 RepID=C3SAU4_9ADEN|nr:pV [Murine adenovirus 3]ACJ14514.1 pV [Murine adenovirus 3]
MEDSRVFLDHTNATPSFVPVTPQVPVPALSLRRIKREHVQLDEEPTVQVLVKRPKMEDGPLVPPPLPSHEHLLQDPVAAVQAVGGQVVRRRRRRLPGNRIGVETIDVLLPSGVRYHPSIQLSSGRHCSTTRRRRRRRRRRRYRATAAYRSSAEAIAERAQQKQVAKKIPTPRYHPSIVSSVPTNAFLQAKDSAPLPSVRYHPTIH